MQIKIFNSILCVITDQSIVNCKKIKIPGRMDVKNGLDLNFVYSRHGKALLVQVASDMMKI